MCPYVQGEGERGIKGEREREREREREGRDRGGRDKYKINAFKASSICKMW